MESAFHSFRAGRQEDGPQHKYISFIFWLDGERRQSIISRCGYFLCVSCPVAIRRDELVTFLFFASGRWARNNFT